MTTEAQRKANERYKEKHPDKIRESQRKYREKNKEKLAQQRRKKYYENHDKYISYARNYYEKNKEKHLEQSKKYIKNNRAKITKMVNKRRKEVAEELKQKGMIYTYLPKTQRENKMVKSLAKKTGINEDTARQLLIENEWNYCVVCDIFERVTF